MKEDRKHRYFFTIHLLFFLFLFVFSLVAIKANAKDLTSTNYIIRDPVIGTGGGYSSSGSFQLHSEGDTLLTGVGSSATYIGHYGFLYYPFIKTGVLTATPVGAEVDLNWVTSTSGDGWNVSGYNVGIASISGGPYTYTSVGTATNYSYTGLAPGNYCFVVQTLDSLGYVIGTSNEECVIISSVITFDLNTSISDVETISPYSVSLGVIFPTSVRNSGTTDSINMIIAEGDTNASSGVVVTVKNQNGSNGLVSSSVPTDNINSADGTMSAGTENYGLCVITATLSGFARAASYNTGACATNSGTNDIQGLTTTGENILTSTSSPVYGAHAEISVNAAISNVTPAHSDYGDSLTFIATPTF
jgi:hypothetical protein